jgi:hypothetical protein
LSVSAASSSVLHPRPLLRHPAAPFACFTHTHTHTTHTASSVLCVRFFCISETCKYVCTVLSVRFCISETCEYVCISETCKYAKTMMSKRANEARSKISRMILYRLFCWGISELFFSVCLHVRVSQYYIHFIHTRKTHEGLHLGVGFASDS